MRACAKVVVVVGLPLSGGPERAGSRQRGWKTRGRPRRGALSVRGERGCVLPEVPEVPERGQEDPRGGAAKAALVLSGGGVQSGR